MSRTIYIATRGSALALAQSNLVLAECRRHFPDRHFELKIIKTTGDKLQTINLTRPNQQVTKGLFTKELEVAMLNREADFAVHSLKDLPTELPEGLYLSGVSEREDVRDVLVYRSQSIATGEKRGYLPDSQLTDFVSGATVASSSTRRQAQILVLRPDLKTVPIRGNVGTRLQKIAENAQLDATILAYAGLKRLGYGVENGCLRGKDVPAGLLATVMSVEQMLPCVGQAALGYESRIGDKEIDEIISRLNDTPTLQCVTAERAFLHAMGGGCLSPVGAYADISEGKLRLRAVSFRNETVKRTERSGSASEAVALGEQVAADLL
ncbi:MAG TPA: hydroxymethylbilane synthase [Verrucomicrobiae bacterium]